ncbi:septal ring lytic transglycosylase RlpA family protein [Sphingomonas sp. ERG5]|uniref:septal ring lytic transglycosylase RlpA family protein n=1 Tax=Sphingomonas sp. ERG5 TaxID=1381597 RepID=UPI000AB1CB79|nr:septal ring lytic transglycosylase RlpA family protein [Sphingomonas sp. ERG5]
MNNRFALGVALFLAGCGGSGVEATPLQAQQQTNGAEPSYGASYAPPPSGRPGPAQQARVPEPLPVDMPSGTGPRGTSGEQQRYDEVGYASWYGEEVGGGRTASGQPFNPAAITAAHNSLPLGSFVEVTALDSGRTIIALVNDRGPGADDRLIDLSRGAAQLLGVNALAPVRVRLVNPPPPDQMALRQGQAASPRIDAPPSLLTALRRKLPVRATAAAPRPTAARPTATRSAPLRAAPGASYAPPGEPRARPAPLPSAPRQQAAATHGGPGLYVQVAALSNAGRAKALATQLGGRVEMAGSIFRVQIGPFANNALAQRARDDVARRGYGDARIVKTN